MATAKATTAQVSSYVQREAWLRKQRAEIRALDEGIAQLTADVIERADGIDGIGGKGWHDPLVREGNALIERMERERANIIQAIYERTRGVA